ncbi:MAG: hypothetical protein K2M12_01355 [Muribaculaceae bacterium]|nr:hypothetical protein [Muribaculaceae bacterium]
MNSQLFNGKRFAAVYCRDLRMQASSWAWRILVMIGLLTLCLLGGDWFVHNVENMKHMGHPASIYHDELMMLSTVCLMFVSIFTSLGASHFMQGYATPGERINQLMSPASTLEKFISRFLICIVGITLALIAGWYIAECIRVAVGNAVYSTPTLGVTSFFTAITNISVADSALPLSFIILSIVCWQALYVMGSAFFLKNAFLKTWGAACIIEFIVGFACGNLAVFLIRHHIGGGIGISLEALKCAAVAFFAVTTVFAYTVTYFRMKEQEIIQRM